MTKKQQTELISLLRKCADELESEINYRLRGLINSDSRLARLSGNNWMREPYKRQMAPVVRARKLLTEIEGK